MKHIRQPFVAVVRQQFSNPHTTFAMLENLNFDGAIGPACPEVIVVKRWPLRIASGRSLSYSVPMARFSPDVPSVADRRPCADR